MDMQKALYSLKVWCQCAKWILKKSWKKKLKHYVWRIHWIVTSNNHIYNTHIFCPNQIKTLIIKNHATVQRACVTKTWIWIYYCFIKLLNKKKTSSCGLHCFSAYICLGEHQLKYLNFNKRQSSVLFERLVISRSSPAF